VTGAVAYDWGEYFLIMTGFMETLTAAAIAAPSHYKNGRKAGRGHRWRKL